MSADVQEVYGRLLASDFASRELFADLKDHKPARGGREITATCPMTLPLCLDCPRD